MRRSSLDLPGGKLRSKDGQLRLRTTGQAHWGREFEELVLLTDRDGTEVRVGDVARVVDGFEEQDLAVQVDGAPALNGEAAAARDALGALLRGDAPPLLPGSEDDARSVVETLSRPEP